MFLFLVTLADALSTVVGAALGVFFKDVPHRVNDLILGFAAGIMLCAATFGLVQPSLEMGGEYAVLVSTVGILAGMFFLKLVDRFVPHLHGMPGGIEEPHPTVNSGMNRAILFVLAIAIHNFPEGAAVGVSFGTGNMADVISISAGIALQNVPEGMAVIAPLVASGVSRKKAFLLSCITAVVEALGVVFGYLAASLTAAVLPFALAFAGGAMLYIVSDEMIPETHGHGNEGGATEALLLGFCTMMLMDFYL
ncbi:MAG: ZIP family metal transporter [Oscillospiraceae bacterium]|nr:ZIP family metal transporter [Oscillospiraceae bacterium]